MCCPVYGLWGCTGNGELGRSLWRSISSTRRVTLISRFGEAMARERKEDRSTLVLE